MFDKGVGLDLRNELHLCATTPSLMEAERMSEIRRDGMLDISRYAPLAHGDLCER